MTTLSDAPPQLETGWDPGTPDSDTMLRRFVHNHVAQHEAVAAAAGGRTMRTHAFAATDLGRPAALYNSATLLRPLDYEDPDAVLSGIERFYRGGRGEVLLWSPWPTADLTGRGWSLVGHPPLLVRPSQLALPDVPRIRTERVTDRAALARWAGIIVDGFPFPDVDAPASLFGPGLLRDDRLACWLAYDGAEPVTAAALFTANGIAQFAFGATVPGARRQGHWAALVRERLMAAGDLPCAGLFNDNSRLGAERYGFWPITRFTLWSRPRG